MTLSASQKLTPSQIQSGMRFGRWTVIKYSHTNSHRIKYFLCKCDCGTERAVRGTALVDGTSHACSRDCENDLVGQKIGKWTILSKDKSRPRYYWCRCDCGTERSVFSGTLKNGLSKSCGCGKKAYPGIRPETIEKYKQYIGQRFGNLIVKDLNVAGGYYTCQCDCGKIFQVDKVSVISGNTTSCGCKRADSLRKGLAEKYSAYIGKHMNNLTILRLFYKNNNFWFECECDCGKRFTHLATKIVTSYIQSCGCIKSRAEERMDKILSDHGIIFKREYKFNDCRDKQPLPFDFAIFNDDDELLGLMELNGQQHYIEGGWNTKENLIGIQKRDKIKHNFCAENKIPLLVIPYQFYDELEKFLTSSNFWQIITENFND